MDRNSLLFYSFVMDSSVALRKESVDRNGLHPFQQLEAVASLSARRAWIEIALVTTGATTCTVALRKESVDRNPYSRGLVFILKGSLSARRAWIEICPFPSAPGCISVALRKESVDRNLCGGMTASSAIGRSPQGERG